MLRTQEEKLQQMYREKVEAPKENESQLRKKKAHKVLFIGVLSAALTAATAAAACITVVTLHLL